MTEVNELDSTGHHTFLSKRPLAHLISALTLQAYFSWLGGSASVAESGYEGAGRRKIPPRSTKRILTQVVEWVNDRPPDFHETNLSESIIDNNGISPRTKSARIWFFTKSSDAEIALNNFLMCKFLTQFFYILNTLEAVWMQNAMMTILKSA